ncbi:MAG: hypothetical protein WCA00_09655 [Candidatus Acidiferrales bacterium]
MVRKSMIRLVCAFIALVFSASLAFGQQKTQLPRQNPYLKPTKSLAPGAEASVKSNAASSTLSNNNSNKSSAMLPLFNYDVTSSRDGNTYDGTIVGRSPFTNAFGYTAVPAQIVPVIIVTNSVFAGVDASGNVVTAPGVTTFNPSVADDSCLTAPNDVPLKLVQQSPIYNSADFNYGGTDLGTTETTDAFQRANFFKLLNFGNGSDDDNVFYHVLLSPVKTVSAIIINIPAALGVAYPSAVFGGCPTGKEAIIDVNAYETPLFNAISGVLGGQGVNAGTFPMFVTHNVVECEGPDCGSLAPGTGCCILGFHDSSGQQTIGTADFDTSAIFVSPVPDVSDMSHEVAEWMNDPFGNNPVPAWGHIGQQGGCQTNLEVGDPLSGTLAPPIYSPRNGFTYHLQELAFFSWFYGAPSVGIHGWFSDNGTFLQDAGPVCQ